MNAKEARQKAEQLVTKESQDSINAIEKLIEQTVNKGGFECSNNQKLLLADVLEFSHYRLIRAFQDNGLRVYQIYYTMSRNRLAKKFIEALDAKNIS